jgi:superfamily I DNA/RNA helicase
MATARQRFLEDLVRSDSDLKLVVAGPGTGKTYSFRALLSLSPEPRLVLSFINNLVRDLEEKLGDLAEVRTFHRFCRRLLHTNIPHGLSAGFDYFPALTGIIASDTSVLLGTNVSLWDVEAVLHLLEEDNPILVSALRSGEYYDAVGHTDAVYRMVRFFDRHPENIPVYGQIVVDEFQDFSALESRVIDQLSTGSPILVVGDDDQALYAFKHASPRYLRDLAMEGRFERFELPYCSRCTQVLVEAVRDVADHAQALGLLDGRVPKRFECYMPEKRVDSERYPMIIHARCTRQDRRAPYMGRYIEEQVRRIPEGEIREAKESGQPTVLVTGPAQFVGQIHDYLAERFQNVEYKRREQSEMTLLDGYLRLLVNERSRLGWRIVLSIARPDGFNDIIRRAIGDGEELVDLLAEDYRRDHLEIIGLLRKIQDESPLSEDEARRLEDAVGLAIPDLERLLRVRLSEEEEQVEEETAPAEVEVDGAGAALTPEIVVTNLVGAKGLQASHVFVAGLNDEHFPRSNADPTDTEVCELIVALTRCTKQCHVLSCQRFGGQLVRRSVFLDWLANRLQCVDVNAAYFRQ